MGHASVSAGPDRPTRKRDPSRIKGPEAQQFFSDHFVRFANLKVGGSQHAIMCDQQGRIMSDGTALRVAPDRRLGRRRIERGHHDYGLVPRHVLRNVPGARHLCWILKIVVGG